MKKVRFTLVILTLLVPIAYSQVTKFQFRPDYPTVDRIARQYEKEKGPGFALAILEGDKVTYSTSKGQANLSSGKKITQHTPFNLASISKTFTAAGVLKLCENKIIAIDDPIRKYLPQLPKYMDVVNIYHLLTHTSGIPDYERNEDFDGTNEGIFF